MRKNYVTIDETNTKGSIYLEIYDLKFIKL